MPESVKRRNDLWAILMAYAFCKQSGHEMMSGELILEGINKKYKL